MNAKPVKIMTDLFPFLLVPVIIYNIIAMSAGGEMVGSAPAIKAILDAPALVMPMLSGVQLIVNWGEIVVAIATVFLFIEVIKSTSTASASIVNHMLSMLLFVFCLIEFLLLSNFATGTFFIITCIVLVDGLAGMVVTIVSARRDFGVEGISR